MTYNEKKSLYESIMKEISSKIKNVLNESFNSNITKKLYMIAKNYSAEYPNISTRIDVVTYDSDVFNKGRISDGLRFKNGKASDWKASLSDFTDDSFGTHLMIATDAREYLSPFYNNDKKGQEKIEKQGYIIVRRIKEKYDIDDIQSGNIPKDKEDVLAFIQLNENGRKLFDEMGKRFLKRQNDENKPLSQQQQVALMHKDRYQKKDEIHKKYEIEKINAELQEYGLSKPEELEFLKDIATTISLSSSSMKHYNKEFSEKLYNKLFDFLLNLYKD